MKNKMTNHWNLLFLLCLTGLLTMIPVLAFAEPQIVEADGYYTVGDGPDENISIGKARAHEAALGRAAEAAAVFVEKSAAVRNHRLTQSEIKTIAANVLKVLDEKITAETDGSIIRFHCHIVAQTGDDAIISALLVDRGELENATKKMEEYEAAIAALTQENIELKARYKAAGSDTEREEIQAEVKANENAFAAQQFIKQGDDLWEMFRDTDSGSSLPFFISETVVKKNIQDIELPKLELYRKIQSYYQQAIDEDPNNPIGYLRMASITHAIEDVKARNHGHPGLVFDTTQSEAAYLDKAYEIAPDSYEVNVAMSLRHDLSMEQMMEYNQNAMRLAPNRFAFHNRYIAELKEKFDQEQSALYRQKKAKEISEEEYKAEVRRRFNYYAELIRLDYEETLKSNLSPRQRAIVLLWLGYETEFGGIAPDMVMNIRPISDKKEAYQYFIKAAEEDPTYISPLNAICRLERQSDPKYKKIVNELGLQKYFQRRREMAAEKKEARKKILAEYKISR